MYLRRVKAFSSLCFNPCLPPRCYITCRGLTASCTAPKLQMQVKPVDHRLQQSGRGQAKLAIELVEFDKSVERAMQFVFQ